MDRKTLIEVTPNDSFIISNIASSTKWECPFKDNASDIDLDYYFNQSGQKYISPLVNYLLGASEQLTAEASTRLADIAISKYSTRWLKMWDTMKFEYNPIENYRMVESENASGNGTSTSTTTYDTLNAESHNTTVDVTGKHETSDNISDESSNTRTDDLTSTVTHNTTTTVDETVTNNLKDTHSGNITTTNDLTDTTNSTTTNSGDDITKVDGTTTTNGTDNTVNKTFGFNSTTAVPASESSSTSNSTVTNDDTTKLTHGLKTVEESTATHTGTVTEADTTEIAHTGTVDTDNTTTNTGTDTTANTGTVTDSGTNKRTGTGTETIADKTVTGGTVDTSHTGTDSTSGTTSDTSQRTLTRSGNIGVTTSQQMIEAERNLWMWNFFTEVLYPDLDDILTLQIYAT